jgi:hypothetical protein
MASSVPSCAGIQKTFEGIEVTDFGLSDRLSRHLCSAVEIIQ